MPTLLQLLRSQDLGYARIAAELWGLEVLPNDLDAGVEAAAAAMLDEQLVSEVVEALEPEAREALMALERSGPDAVERIHAAFRGHAGHGSRAP